MTHTLETTAISRVVARALRLNEDLTEAIGLGHDMGHTPFGHAGEDALDQALRERFGLRVPAPRAVAPDRAHAQPDPRGLRRDPHAHRAGRAGDARGEDRPDRRPRRVHQPRHRRRDPLRAARRGRSPARGDRAARADAAPTRIDRLVHDLVETSAAAGDIRQSEEIGAAMHRPARVHVRARLPRRARARRAPARARDDRQDRRPPRRARRLAPTRSSSTSRG